MKYSLLRVRKRILYFWKQYLLIAAEYAVGIAILIMCLNISQSSRDALHEVSEMMGENLVQIGCFYKSESQNEKTFPVSYECYTEITEAFGEASVYFGEYIMDYSYLQAEERFVVKHIFFLNENMAYLQLEHGLSNYAYLGVDIYNELAAIGPKDGDDGIGAEDAAGCFYVRDDRLFVTEQVSYPIMILEQEGRISYTSGDSISESSMVDYHDCIFLPIDAAANLPSKDFPTYSSLLSVDPGTYEAAAVLEKLTALLSEGNRNYEFRVSDHYLATKSTLDAITAEFVTWKWCAVVIVALVVLTVIGLFSLIYLRRQKAVAVAISFGEKPVIVWFENFMEIVSVLLVGWFAGVIVGEILTSRHVNRYFKIYGYSSFILWTLLFSVICSVLVLIIAGGRVNKHKLSLVMRDL